MLEVKVIERVEFKSEETGKTYHSWYEFFIQEAAQKVTARFFREDGTEIKLSNCKTEEDVENVFYETAWVINNGYQEAVAGIQNYFFSEIIVPVEDGMWHQETSRPKWFTIAEYERMLETAKNIIEHADKRRCNT